MVWALYSRSCPKNQGTATGARQDRAHVTGLFGGSGAHVPKVMRFTSFPRMVFSWSSKSGPSRWPTRLLHPIKVSQTNDSGRAVGRATKGFRQPPFRGRVLMKSETRSPLSFYVTPHNGVRSPVVCLSAPLCWVKAEHEENASQRHSTGRATGRSG